jgi:hypothetical protein
MVVISAGLRSKSDCSGKAQKQLYGKLQTRPLVWEGAPHQETRNRQTEKKIWSWAPDGGTTPRQTGRLTVGRKLTSTRVWSELLCLGTETVIKKLKFIREHSDYSNARMGARGSVVVQALCYKPEGRGLDTRWGEFFNVPNPSGRIRPWSSLGL